MTEQPTQEQIRELWEWCGLVYLDGAFYEKDNHHPVIAWGEKLSLNNLFKYAMPKLNKCGKKLRMLGQKRDKQTYFCSVGGNNMSHVYTESDNPALALFWAIWEVLKC